MNRRQAFEHLASKYKELAEFVYKIEDKYFQKKGCYHKDITQDLYLKIYAELQKVEEKPGEISKFIDRVYNGKTFYLYMVVKNMFIDLIRKEKKYVPFDTIILNKNERERLIQKATELNIKEVENIQFKVNQYVDSFYWFDKKVFNLYRYDFKTHQTKMSKETKLSISTIYRTVKRCKVKINNKLKKEYYEE